MCVYIERENERARKRARERERITVQYNNIFQGFYLWSPDSVLYVANSSTTDCSRCGSRCCFRLHFQQHRCYLMMNEI